MFRSGADLHFQADRLTEPETQNDKLAAFARDRTAYIAEVLGRSRCSCFVHAKRTSQQDLSPCARQSFAFCLPHKTFCRAPSFFFEIIKTASTQTSLLLDLPCFSSFFGESKENVFVGRRTLEKTRNNGGQRRRGLTTSKGVKGKNLNAQLQANRRIMA